MRETVTSPGPDAHELVPPVEPRGWSKTPRPGSTPPRQPHSVYQQLKWKTMENLWNYEDVRQAWITSDYHSQVEMILVVLQYLVTRWNQFAPAPWTAQLKLLSLRRGRIHRAQAREDIASVGAQARQHSLDHVLALVLQGTPIAWSCGMLPPSAGPWWGTESHDSDWIFSSPQW